MSSRLKNNKLTVITLLLCIFLLFTLSTIVYSAFSSTMNINGVGFARVEVDVRITDFNISDTTNGSISMYESFGKDFISSEVNLKSNSSITYNLEITNYGSSDVGIYSISGLPDGVNYSLEGYNLKDKICDQNDKCNNYAVGSYKIKLYTTANSYEGSFNLEFIFKQFHNINYLGFSNNYVSYIMDGESMEIDFSLEGQKNVVVDSSCFIEYDVSDYSLYLNSVLCDINLELIDEYFVEYVYTGDVQKFIAPYDGFYKLETWGAQGGNIHNKSLENNYTTSAGNITRDGGYGGYATGSVYLDKNALLYIYVGGKGDNSDLATSTISGGFNGGGTGGSGVGVSNCYSGAGGGGATHIATTDGLLSTLENKKDNILIVSGGGGGALNHNYISKDGGSGGGVSGGNGITNKDGVIFGGTQSVGYKFGAGSNGVGGTQNSYDQSGSAGGGGGFYGGSTDTSNSESSSGSGGSGYIGNELLRDKYMVCYNCLESNEYSEKTISVNDKSSVPISDIPKSDNGYAKITLLNPQTSFKINYLGFEDSYQYQSFVKRGGNFVVDFKDTAPLIVKVFINGELYNDYDYSNGILSVRNVFDDVEVVSGQITYNFDFSNSVQVFEVLYDGLYKLETWGAQGGGAHNRASLNDYMTSSGNYIKNGGYGGYSKGEIILSEGDILYIYVGGQGQNSDLATSVISGGYNGGGSGGSGLGIYNCYSGAGGGGATHIATTDGLLSKLSNNRNSILIVSGGGGGALNHNYISQDGGSGGGISGGQGIANRNSNYAGGNQTTGYAFGLGSNGSSGTNSDYNQSGSGGGGGGYWGGYSDSTTSQSSSGAGGSGYIGNSNLTNKHMSCFNCETSTVESTKTISITNVSEVAISDYAKQGNGYAKITLLEFR